MRLTGTVHSAERIDNMNTVKKRIFCITTALLLAVFPLLSSSLPARAASIPVSPDASAESLMVLLDLLINANVAGGAADASADYNSEMDLLDAFFDFVENIVPVGQAPEAKFYLADGSSVTLDDLCTGLEDGTVTLPNEQEWGKYRVGFGDDFASILEAWEERGGGSGGGGSDPEDPEEPQFALVNSFAINAAFLTLASDFFSSLWNGEIEGLSYSAVSSVPEFYFNPQSQTADGFYCKAGPLDASGQYFSGSVPSASFLGNHSRCFLFTTQSYSSGAVSYNYAFCGLVNSTTQRITTYNIPLSDSSTYSSGIFKIYDNYISSSSPRVFSTNIPVFTNETAALNYLLSGVSSSAVNGLRYDYDSLIGSIPSVLLPMSGLKLSPSALQKIYARMKTAYQTDISPKPATDVTTDTGIYIDTMTDTVVDTMPSVTPSPSPDPDPGGTGTGTETGTDVDIDDYKRDLRLIFPFCIPFDFISLLRVLDAEPVTPVFEVPFSVPVLGIDEKVVLDLSFLDDIMEVFRVCEVVSFIIVLMSVTHKMIKW